MSENSNIKDTAETVKGIVQAIPIYQDLAQPAVQEIGKGLCTIAKTVHLALAPVAALVWGFDQIKDYAHKRVAEKLERVPPERIATPSPSVAGPALEALRYNGHDPDLREMYATLLATAMDTETALTAHPAFVEIIKQLTPDEAKLLRWFSGPEQPLPVIKVSAGLGQGKGAVAVMENFSLLGEKAGCVASGLTSSYLTNICRLGLIQIPDSFYADETVYDELLSHPHIMLVKQAIAARGRVFEVNKRIIEVTPLGRQFIDACVQSKVHQ
jgi:hypothetical protein